MTRYLCYWPEIDSVDCLGFLLEVEDFHPALSGRSLDAEDEEMRAATRHLPETPFPPEDPESVALPVPCEGPGFTYAELRVASVAYRATRGLGCFFNPVPTEPETPLCGQPAGEDGLCPAHARKGNRPARGPSLQELQRRES